ncbi:hypothetical protein HHK36_024330 [Tetracentron sinense]|uniref:Uncharacterized protein n=1 Tax=Tetracentron sinense TaxID=13715 RepID=A0A834YQF2_TETSI|nr:hypothetical protein HHK36_024330 [Tetracentron sinense]
MPPEVTEKAMHQTDEEIVCHAVTENQGGIDTRNPEEISAWFLSKIADFSAFLGLSYEGHEPEVLALFCSLEPQRGSTMANANTGETRLSNKRLEKELRRLSSYIQFPQPSNPVRGAVQKAQSNLFPQ